MGHHARWTEDTNAQLRRLLNEKSPRECAAVLGLSVEQVCRQARVLGVTFQRSARRAWTPEEDEVIRSHYALGGTPACAARLPGRHRGAIQARAVVLGVHYRGPYGESGKATRCDHRALGHALGMDKAAPIVPAAARVVRRLA